MFRCKWVNLNGEAGVKVDQMYGITTADLTSFGYRDEPSVLAKYVARVFYVNVLQTEKNEKISKQIHR